MGTSAGVQDASSFESGEDPTGSPARRLFALRVTGDVGTRDAIDALLELPGVAAVTEPDPATILVDVAPEVVSGDELRAAAERAGVTVVEIGPAETHTSPPIEREGTHDGA
jgi:hypothetical protein